MTSVETNLLQRVMTRALEWFLIFLMIVLTAVVVVAVLYRIAGDSLSWYDEVAAVLLSWVTYYGACLAALERKHIGVDSVLLMLPTKFRLIGVIVAEAFVIGFFVLMAWAGYQVVMILVTPVLLTLLGTFLVPYVLVISIGNILRLPKADLTLERKSQKYWLFTFSSASKLTLNQLLQLPR